MIGAFRRYTDEKHRNIVDAFPELEGTIIRPTYEEAARAAHDEIISELVRQQIPSSRITFVHHSHRETGIGDPLDAIGSWGWKVT